MSIVNFFDKLEDHVRGFLSRRPIFYGLIAGIGIVLFWRGVWHTADTLIYLYVNWTPEFGIDWSSVLWWDGPLSFVIGTATLLLSGVFVSEFIGKEIIISGLKGEKKLTEKTEKEVKTEVSAIGEIRDMVRQLHDQSIKDKQP